LTPLPGEFTPLSGQAIDKLQAAPLDWEEEPDPTDEMDPRDEIEIDPRDEMDPSAPNLDQINDEQEGVVEARGKMSDEEGGGHPFSPEGGGGEPPPSPLPPLPHRPPLSNTIGGPQEGGMGGDVYGVAAAALRMNFARRIAKGGGSGPIGGTNQNQGKDPLPGTQD
jgi:hypothetical protein